MSIDNVCSTKHQNELVAAAVIRSLYMTTKAIGLKIKLKTTAMLVLDAGFGTFMVQKNCILFELKCLY